MHFGQTVVLYRETPAGIAEGFEAYTMPKPCWAVVRLDIRPLKRGDGVRFYSTVADSVLLPRYQNHVEQSLFQNLEQGLRGFFNSLNDPRQAAVAVERAYQEYLKHYPAI